MKKCIFVVALILLLLTACNYPDMATKLSKTTSGSTSSNEILNSDKFSNITGTAYVPPSLLTRPGTSVVSLPENTTKGGNNSSSKSTDYVDNNTKFSFESLGLTQPKVGTPATVYFGTFNYMDQLTSSPNSWEYCKKNADGILLHGAYWINSMTPASTAIGQKFADIIGANKNLKTLLEYTWPASTNIRDATLGTRMGTNLADKVKTFQDSTGLKINEFSLDWLGYFRRDVLVDNPNYSLQQAEEYEVKAWEQFYTVINSNFPDTTSDITCSPIYFTFNYPGSPFSPTLPFANTPIDNRTGNTFNGYDLYPRTFDISRPIKPLNGFVLDSPYSYLVGDGLVGTPDQSMRLRQTITNYCKWLKDNGYKSTSLVNTSSAKEVNQTLYDKTWTDQTNKTMLYLQQTMGMRFDRYVVESWFPGPYQLVPETKENTYMNVVMKILKYLKGTGQKMDLKLTDAGTTIGADVYAPLPNEQESVSLGSSSSKTYTITVKNNGEYACLPCLKYVATPGCTVSVTYDSTNVTSQFTSDDGYCFDNTSLAAGAERSISVTVTRTDNAAGSVAFCAFYNPQDSTNTIKDVITINY
jgi:hypothetical protein